MAIYRDQILPFLIHHSMRQKNLVSYRARIIPAAEGRVLEVGIGSGLNLPFYTASVDRVIGLEPSPKLLSMTHAAARDVSTSVDLIEGSSEAIPLNDGSIDTVVTTWTLCTIPNASRALQEMLRVLKPTGRLLFIEHGRAPDASIRWWQDHLNPIWKRLSGGCELNRPIHELIQSAGFRTEQLKAGYLFGPNPLTFFYEGSARPR